MPTPENFHFSIGHAIDEFGQGRWFVQNEDGDWVDGPYDTPEEVATAITKAREERSIET